MGHSSIPSGNSRFVAAIAAIFITSIISTGVLADQTRDYIGWALRGDLSVAERDLDRADATEEEKALLEKFRARFITQTNGLALEAIGDPFVQHVGSLYQDYWRQALIDPEQRSLLEEELTPALVRLLEENGFSSATLNQDTVLDHLKAAIEAKGFQILLGRTPPLLEFMLWSRNEKETYRVELSDRVQEVNVYFLVGFLSRGWAHFATFGKASAGGWATKEGLYAVKESYDLDSEKFLVSYLKHEGRHFADYSLYPKLEGADLEYRAKLTELAFAEDTLQHLLTRFTRHAARVENAPHSLANWHVINNLSSELLEGTWPKDAEVWPNIPVAAVQAAASKLLEVHDNDLITAGANTTQGIVKP